MTFNRKPISRFVLAVSELGIFGHNFALGCDIYILHLLVDSLTKYGI